MANNIGMKIVCSAKSVPDKIVKNDDLSSLYDTNDEWIYSRTGIKERRITTDKNTAAMCIDVAQKLLEKSGMKAEELDLIIVSTTTSDYLIPSAACMVHGAIGATKAFAFDLSAACTGYVYALSTAHKFLSTYKNIMVIASETNSKIVDWSDRSISVLFGDGAGGVIITQSDEQNYIREVLCSDGSKSEALTTGKSSVSNFLQKPEEVDNRLVYMDGKAIFNFAKKQVITSIIEVLSKENITLDKVKYIVPHQANARLIDAMAIQLNTTKEKFFMNLDRYGNTSSASIAIALDEMIEGKLIKRGDLLLLTGFGGGLTWGSILIKY